MEGDGLLVYVRGRELKVIWEYGELQKPRSNSYPRRTKTGGWRWSRDVDKGSTQAFGVLSEHFPSIGEPAPLPMPCVTPTLPFLEVPRAVAHPSSSAWSSTNLLSSVSPDCALEVSGTHPEPSIGPGWPESMVTELCQTGTGASCSFQEVLSARGFSFHWS